jgi:transcription elongation factor Elf1
MSFIDTSWECPACTSMNHGQVKKPGIFDPIIATKHCEVCDSKFMIRFSKVIGEHRVLYTILRYTLTDHGKAQFDKKNKQPAGTNPAGNTKGENTL